jgi:hypothetical protein
MAINCAALGSEVSAIASTYNSLNSQWGTTLSSGLNAAQTDQVGVATSALNQLINTRDKISDLEDQLDFLLDEAEEGNCADVITYGDEYSFRLFQTREAISAGISNLRAAIKTSNDRLAASQKATTSKSNPGTGTPGTAEPDEEFLDEDAEIIDDEPLPEVDDFVDGTGLTEPPIGDEDDFLGGDGDTDDFLGIDGDTDEFLGDDNTNQGLDGDIIDAQSQTTLQDEANFLQTPDWRVKLSLSPGSYYLYNDEQNVLLEPLRRTDGIIFPYTPTISVTYGANYQSNNPVHSNYKIFQYENSYVDSFTITCDFTAQDSEEAKYLLAVIHFLRSATKMFYGQDQNPKPGTPPPLVYIFGMGEFQFNAHPLVINNFTYSLPPDVDYIRAGEVTQAAGVNRGATADAGQTKSFLKSAGSLIQGEIQARLDQGIAAVGNALGLKLQPGGSSQGYQFGMSNRFNAAYPPGTKEPTYVPTKMNISISALPIVSRYDVSNNFSVKDYANGSLLQGVKRKSGGFW